MMLAGRNLIPPLALSPFYAVDPSFYTNLVRYGNFAATSIGQNCPVPPDRSTVLNYIKINFTNTQAIVFRADTTREIIVSFGGSKALRDAVTDISFVGVGYAACTGCSVHLGFRGAWVSISEQIRRAIAGALAVNRGYTVTLTGHSLGGALTSLAFADLRTMPEMRIAQAWAFASPRVGNHQYAAYVDLLAGATDVDVGSFYRVTHANDGVPLLPPTGFGYRHSKTEIWAGNDASGQPSAATTYRCYGNEPADCVNSQGGVGINNAHVFYPGINYGTTCK
ncbi:feruloyl esterase A precursor [Fimicolochytrium jonesii]|uniref:feruloyl esterase A precursor n=1 Tax=Fimicolochytrium jonesii TaxID=1396493 RepID=UPI0022FE1487|nr:feruloyl esterase A precursor [Fimicolochytrium jonesii]KAI8817000.1 feruloyl esterase A precursor [Fimicolochytrium jonesii]